MKNRHSTRLRGFDYSKAGAYFITLCAWQREETFGQVLGERVALSEAGRIVRSEWLASAAVREELRLDAFVVMPNHFHAIVWLRHGHRSTLGRLVSGFKSSVTSRINAFHETVDRPVWQRNFHDRVVRHNAELLRIRQYIKDNPKNWASDPNHPNQR